MMQPVARLLIALAIVLTHAVLIGCGGPPVRYDLLGDCTDETEPSPGDHVPPCIKTAEGIMAVESTYIAGVVQCELAGLTSVGAALEAQAIAARTYLAGFLARRGPDAEVPIGPRFQCWRSPTHARSRSAAVHTAGVVMLTDAALINSNYVSGARRMTFDCKPKSPAANGYDGYRSWAQMRKVDRARRDRGDRTRFKGYSWTEIWVTRNEGRSGDAVQPTPMAPKRKTNRGAFGQYAAVCLAENMGYETADILRYFFGDDVGFSRPLVPVEESLDPGEAPPPR